MGAVDGLLLGLRVPPRVQQEDVVGLGEREPEAAGLEGDEEDVGLAGPEGVDDLLSVGGGAVHVGGSHTRGLQVLAHAGEVARELGEDEGAVPLGEDRPQVLDQHLDLGRRARPSARPPVARRGGGDGLALRSPRTAGRPPTGGALPAGRVLSALATLAAHVR